MNEKIDQLQMPKMWHDLEQNPVPRKRRRKRLRAVSELLGRIVRTSVKTPVRFVYQVKYGIRGGLRPPMKRGRGKLSTFVYHYRYVMWRLEASVYEWTGLPERWSKWRLNERSVPL